MNRSVRRRRSNDLPLSVDPFHDPPYPFPRLEQWFRGVRVNIEKRAGIIENGWVVWNGYIFGSEEIYNPSLAIYQGKLLQVVNVEIYQQQSRTTFLYGDSAGCSVCVCVCVCARAQMSSYVLNIPPPAASLRYSYR